MTEQTNEPAGDALVRDLRNDAALAELRENNPGLMGVVRADLGLVYLAAPYSAGDEAVERERVEKVTDVAAQLIAHGYHVFSPLTYTVRIADRGAQPPAGWYEFDLQFLDACEAIAVLTLEGWERSKGVGIEIANAVANMGPDRIAYLHPDSDPVAALDAIAHDAAKQRGAI